MGTLVFQANLGGAVNLNGPNIATTVNLTLPSADGTSGQALVTNGSGVLSFSSFVSAAAGSNTQVQFNSGGAFAGSANLTFDGTTLTAAGLSGPHNGTVGATTPNTGSFTTLTSSSGATLQGLTVGRGAGAVSTNTAVGASALASNNTANEHTAVGYQTLQANTSASRNTAVGYRAGTANTSGHVTAVGAYVLLANTTGTGNTGIGGNDEGIAAALQSNTTGNYNIAVGTGALLNNTTASNNTSVGYQSLQANTTASNNTALGYQAGYLSTNVNNTFIGYLSGYGVTSQNNVAVGAWALQGSSTGIGNTAIGLQSMYSNTSGTSNSTTGLNSLFSNTTGSYNSAFGHSALYSNTTASNNTAVGYQAGYSETVGLSNTFLGYQSGYTQSNAASNTFIGSGAGYLVSSGAKNTIIGRYNGNNGGLDIRTASNYIVLSDGDGNPRGIFDNNGNWLVGTTSDAGLGITFRPSSTIIQNNNAEATGFTFSAFRRSSTTIGSITQSGTTAVLYNVTSDQRLKQNIVDAPEFGNVIDLIQVRSYDWKEGGNHQRAGFVAQELVTVAPEAVHQPADPEEMMAVDYSKLVPMLVKELQSLRKRVAQLESK